MTLCPPPPLQSGVKVINLSLGSIASPALDFAVDAAVVAAGNDNADACTKSPARAREGRVLLHSTSTLVHHAPA